MQHETIRIDRKSINVCNSLSFQSLKRFSYWKLNSTKSEWSNRNNTPILVESVRKERKAAATPWHSLKLPLLYICIVCAKQIWIIREKDEKWSKRARERESVKDNGTQTNANIQFRCSFPLMISCSFFFIPFSFFLLFF